MATQMKGTLTSR